MANIPTKKLANTTPNRFVKPLPAKPKKEHRNADTPKLIKVEHGNFPLDRTNFIIMIAAAAAIVIGFLLMLGGSSTETEFNPDIFSTRRIIIGPTITFLGFVAMAVGIIYLPRRKKAKAGNEATEIAATSTDNENI